MGRFDAWLSIWVARWDRKKRLSSASSGWRERRNSGWYLTKNLVTEFSDFVASGIKFLFRIIVKWVVRFEFLKSRFAGVLYQQRGRWTRPFSHVSMGGLVVIGLALAPVVASGYLDLFGEELNETNSASAVLAYGDLVEVSTIVPQDRQRDKVLEYEVKPGDTVSYIAEMFGVSMDTIRWQNNLSSVDAIKPGQVLEILPLTGILHKVKKGETVYSIAKKYESEPQAIVDYPFNTFVNDETFSLAIGQDLLVPDGVKAEEPLWSPRSYVAQKTPDAGAVAANGQFVWPVGGTITQRFAWYHKGTDIANRSAPGIVAADSGKVIVAGWPDRSGYGNRVMIDHGNGFVTLYAHLSSVYVVEGQRVNRGDLVGQMGSTGRSTGTHLHFEIRYNGVAQNPLNYLK